MSGFLHLSDDELAGLGITTSEVIAAIEHAVRAQAEGRLWTTPKSAVTPGDGRYVMTTLAVGDDPALTVVKCVSVNPRNAARGIDSINGAIMIMDSETGVLRAVVDANWITAVRTAGLSATVARRLADPEARTVAFLGCGVQARSHLAALADLFPLAEIRAYGRGRANIDNLCIEAEGKGLTALVAETPAEAMRGADLVVSSMSLTYGAAPFVNAGDLKPGAFASISDTAWAWVPDSMSALGTVLIDDHAQEAAIGKSMTGAATVSGDLAELITGQIGSRHDPARPSAFIFRGLAIGDFALAALAYQRAATSTPSA